MLYDFLTDKPFVLAVKVKGRSGGEADGDQKVI